jgi:nicotinic acid mononucleotide adenylyltransferase/1-acyl-sn-glycerol-3-phosphate acyltransferase
MTETSPGTPNEPHHRELQDSSLDELRFVANQDALRSETSQGGSIPLFKRTEEMWRALGVTDLPGAIGPNQLIGQLAQRHLEEHPWGAHSSRIAVDSMLWYEGSYDPIGVHHFKIFYDTFRELGFERATLAIVYKHPFKSSLAYEHRYEMAKLVLETAGFTVVDNYTKAGICLFPPGEDGLNRFHVARIEALYNPKNFILIGPDNFDRALETNILWTHIDGVKNSVSGRARYGFRSMYDGGIVGLKDRLIVYPYLNSVHSTNIRNGEVPMLAPVQQYVEQHGLYRPPAISAPSAQPISSQSTQAPAASRDGATTSEEMAFRRDLLTRVGLGLPWSFSETREMYQAVLGSADRSELRGLLNILEKCHSRADCESSPKLKYFFDKRAPLATKLVSLFSQTVIGGDIQIWGVEQVAKIHDMLSGRFIFIANESGWGDLPVFTHALETCRLGSLAENLTFVYNRDVFKTPVLAGLVGHAATVIKPTPAVTASEPEVQRRAYKNALHRGLDQLNHGPVVLFPEDGGSAHSAFELATIGAEVVEGLKSYIDRNEDPDIAPDKVFVIPVGMVGGDYLSAHRNSEPFSGDYPAVVKFGAAIPVTTLLALADQHGDEVTAHVIGHRVATLLPTEWRGTYAIGASNSQRQEDARQIAEELTDIDANAITRRQTR